MKTERKTKNKQTNQDINYSIFVSTLRLGCTKSYAEIA